MRCAFLSLFLVAPLLLADDKSDPDPKDPKVKPREVEVKGLPTGRGAFTTPTKIASEEDLKKQVTDDDTRKAILKQVNFKKEYLVLFRWAGSGGDRASFTTNEKTGDVTFNLQRGLTRDLRMHSKLYALPTGAKYTVGGAAKKGGGIIIKKRDR